MIQLEQVCRYRKDKGYGISAKTPGITSAQEDLLGEVFNDSMNTLFPKVGTSCLSCIAEDGSLFYARNTLRTDIHGRISLYTHSYVLSEEDYEKLLAKAPGALLEIPMAQLSDAPGGDSLEPIALQLDYRNDAKLQQLMRKYDLTPERYADLLYAAYHAVLNHWPLRLVTSQPFEAREQLIRELTMCIMSGLLPCMRKRLSFSSGPDWRMCLSVVGTEDQLDRLDREDLVFGVEDEELTNIRITDSFRGAFFHAVAEATPGEREELLELVQLSIHTDLHLDTPGSIMVVATAYANTYGDGSPLSKLNLFCGLKACAGQGIDATVADAMMTRILKELHEKNAVDLNVISHLSDWYLRRSSDAYRFVANEILTQKADANVGVVLISAALKTKDTPNKAALIVTLMAKAPLDAKKWSDTDKKKLFHWIVSTDQVTLLNYVEQLLPLFEGEYPQMLERMLKHAEGAMLSKTQIDIQRKTMARILKDGLTLSEIACGYLDSHILEFDAQTDPSGVICQQLAVYMLDKRLDQSADMLTQVHTLLSHAKHSEYYCMHLEKELDRRFVEAITEYRAGVPRGTRVTQKQIYQDISRGDKNWVKPCLRWEYYLAEKYMGPDTDARDIPDICCRYNSFYYFGYFEQKAADILTKGALAELNYYFEKGERRSLQNLVCEWLDCIDYLQAIKKKLSKKTSEIIMANLIDAYWEAVSIRDIFHNLDKKKNTIATATESYGSIRSRARLALQTSVTAYRMKWNASQGKAGTREFVRAVLAMWKFDEASVPAIREEIEYLLFETAARGGELPLDLILLCCLKLHGDNLLDGKKTRQLLDKLQERIDKSAVSGPAPRVRWEDAEYLKDRKDKKHILDTLKSTLGQRSKLEDQLIRELDSRRRPDILRF